MTRDVIQHVADGIYDSIMGYDAQSDTYGPGAINFQTHEVDDIRGMARAAIDAIPTDVFARLLANEFESFLEHPPHNPNLFWQQAARALKDRLSWTE